MTNILKKLPQRTCIGCNTQKDKKDLIRIVKNKDGVISLDKTGKAQGRGAYLCDNTECLEKAIKSRKLEKSFEMKIEDTIYEELRKRIKE
ncbi:MAG: YlxR family protein [Clostridia bacterium]|nr:YlxR family protein [Clostridia bacterium]